MSAPTMYLIDVYGCVEPSLIGPIPEAEFDAKARQVRAAQDEEDALFGLTIFADGRPSIWSFSAGFFLDEDPA